MTAIPILIYWTIALWGLFSRRPVLIYLFFAGVSFGALAVVPPTVTAGLTFVPAPMTAMLIVLKTFANGRSLSVALSSALDPRRLGVLVAFFAVTVVVTIFMPRIFINQVYVIPMRGADLGKGLLGPTVQNISQLAYLFISVTAVFAFAQILKSPAMRQTLLRAILLGGAITIATGLLDLSSQFIPITPFLDLFRTATYNLLTDTEIAGSRRIVGLMPEASAFGSTSLSMLCFIYFMRRAVTNDRLRDVYAPPLILGLFVFAWLSTSSATYVGLAVFLLMAAIEWLFRFFEGRYSHARRRHLGLEFALAAGGGLAVVAIILFQPAIIDAITHAIDQIVLQKTTTSSYEERSMWTAVSLQALFDTYGLGVGMGGTRASNSVVAVISNVGLIGAVFYFGFILQSLLRRAAPGDHDGVVLISALRYAFFPPFIVGLLVGTSADFGAIGALRYGLLTAIGVGGLYASPMVRRMAPPRLGVA